MPRKHVSSRSRQSACRLSTGRSRTCTITTLQPSSAGWNRASSAPWARSTTKGRWPFTIEFSSRISRLANLRDFGCDFQRFWETQTRKQELASIVRDQCWCTHICFIHDSLRHSPKVLLYDIPVTYLESRFAHRSVGAQLDLPAG